MTRCRRGMTVLGPVATCVAPIQDGSSPLPGPIRPGGDLARAGYDGRRVQCDPSRPHPEPILARIRGPPVDKRSSLADKSLSPRTAPGSTSPQHARRERRAGGHDVVRPASRFVPSRSATDRAVLGLVTGDRCRHGGLARSAVHVHRSTFRDAERRRPAGQTARCRSVECGERRVARLRGTRDIGIRRRRGPTGRRVAGPAHGAVAVARAQRVLALAPHQGRAGSARAALPLPSAGEARGPAGGAGVARELVPDDAKIEGLGDWSGQTAASSSAAGRDAAEASAALQTESVVGAHAR